MIELNWGPRDAYGELSRFHYRGGLPATIAKRGCGGDAVVVARDPHEDQRVAGILIVSMPTLNGSWRRMPWRDRYESVDKSEAARRLNSEIRCLSRVVVDPRYRGRGLASRLVRWYLQRRLTPRTEAVAVMGRFHPFFERAGMTAYPLAPSSRHARLMDALHAAGTEPHELLAPGAAERLLASHAWLEHELRRWAIACRSTRSRSKSMSAVEIARLAGGMASSPLTAYAHGGVALEEECAA